MKKLYAFLAVLVVLCSSCQRSQFATSTRVYKNGRVTYVKSYHHESRKRTKAISSERNKISTTEMAGITPMPGIQSGDLVASATLDPTFIVVKGNRDLLQADQRIVNSVRLHPDTIAKADQQKERQNDAAVADPRKVEKLGLAGFILSIPGLVPIVCLPLAILGLIFGIVSLKRIKRDPALYKGKGFAVASIILGVLGILGILLFIG